MAAPPCGGPDPSGMKRGSPSPASLRSATSQYRRRAEGPDPSGVKRAAHHPPRCARRPLPASLRYAGRGVSGQPCGHFGSSTPYTCPCGFAAPSPAARGEVVSGREPFLLRPSLRPLCSPCRTSGSPHRSIHEKRPPGDCLAAFQAQGERLTWPPRPSCLPLSCRARLSSRPLPCWPSRPSRPCRPCRPYRSRQPSRPCRP